MSLAAMAWANRRVDPVQHRRNIWRTALYISRYGRVSPKESMAWPVRDVSIVIEELSDLLKREGETRE